MSTDETQGGALVVSLLARTLDDFRAALRGGAASDADVVEFRIDRVVPEIMGAPQGTLGELLGLAGRPTIVALHGAEGFGTFGGGPRERAAALDLAAAEGADFIDIDGSLLGEAQLADSGARRILSTHRALPTLDAESLDGVAAELDALRRPGRGDLVKIIPHAERAEDALLVLDWVAARPMGSTIAFASGAAAAYSRLAAPGFGSVFVYAAAAAPGKSGDDALLASAAPGQLRVPHVRAVWGGPGRQPGPKTLLAAVCGRPIGHSASPVTHGAAFRTLGLDALFLPVAPTSFERLSQAVRDHPRWVGLSVTAPFKLDALGLAVGDDGAGMGDAAAALGAANTLRFVPSRPGSAARSAGASSPRSYRASNTDAPAVSMALAEAFQAAGAEGRSFEGRSAVVIGAGGAARAAVFALLHGGAQVTIAARRLEAAVTLADSVAAGEIPAEAVDLATEEYRALRPDIIVHTTPLGTDGIGEPFVPDEHLRPGVAVLDAVYRPRETALLRRAGEKGAIPVSGERWFLLQAWLQHSALFERHYPQTNGGSVPLGEAAEAAAQAAMGAALGDWLAGATSSEG